jgi:hypothetical protein
LVEGGTCPLKKIDISFCGNELINVSDINLFMLIIDFSSTRDFF